MELVKSTKMKELAKPIPLKALPLPDTELVKKAKKGDNQAFEELVRRYEQRVYNIAYRMLGNEEEAKDALQDTFLRAFRFIKKFKGNSTFYTWLYRITTNVCLTHLKQKKGKEKITLSLDAPVSEEEDVQREIPDNSLSPDVLYERRRMAKALQQAIGELPSDYRSVVILRDLQGLSNKEVGKALQLSIAAVKSRLHRGRVFLRNRLSKYLDTRSASVRNESEKKHL